jgi:hypothetical protein
VELPRRNSGRNACLSALGDWNADGVSEWACIESGAERPSLVLVFDGRSGKLLRETIVPALDPANKFAGVLGDLDRDGYPEALVANSPAQDERKFAIHSLHDGALKADLDLGATNFTEVSHSLGLAECGLILFAGPTERDPPLQLIALDWKSGAQVFALEWPATQRDQLDGLHRLPDIDGDALPDFAVAVAGQVELRSSSGGALLSTLAGAHAWELFGRNLVAIPMRGGGLLLAVSAENGGPVSQGRVDVFDSRGRKLHTLEQSSSWHFSAGLVSAGDCDGDGTAELLIAVDHTNSHNSADAWVYNPRTGELLDVYTRLSNSVVRWP